MLCALLSLMFWQTLLSHCIVIWIVPLLPHRKNPHTTQHNSTRHLRVCVFVLFFFCSLMNLLISLLSFLSCFRVCVVVSLLFFISFCFSFLNFGWFLNLRQNCLFPILSLLLLFSFSFSLVMHSFCVRSCVRVDSICSIDCSLLVSVQFPHDRILSLARELCNEWLFERLFCQLIMKKRRPTDKFWKFKPHYYSR